MKCFYHRTDLDGICSAAIVHLKHPECELIGIDYGEGFPWNTIKPDDTVYMVDFSLQKPDGSFGDMDRLGGIVAEKGKLIWIEHHKSALEAYEEWLHDTGYRIDGIQRIGLGACALVWEFLYPTEPLPYAVKLLAEYDVWDHSDENCLPFQYGLKARWPKPTDPIWDKMLFTPASTSPDFGLVVRIIEEGRPVLKWKTEQREISTKVLCFETELDGLRLIAANHGPENSQFFDSVWDPERHDAMCLFYWAPKKNAWTVGLYAPEDIAKERDFDLGEIAQEHGGGGHLGAAGFQCKTLPFDLDRKSR
jgi:hypothetical protein